MPKSIKTEGMSVVEQGWSAGEGDAGGTPSRYRVFFQDDENVLTLTLVTVPQFCECVNH